MLRRLLTALGRDYVVLRNHEGKHSIRPVRWECGVPFAAPYLPDTACHLMPGGGLRGPSYMRAWLPASPRMQRYFGQTVSGDVGSASLSGETK